MTTAQTETPALPAKLGTGAQMAYGVGQIAGQIFRDLPSLLLFFFMTNALGISPALAGLSIFAPKLIWGVICDVGVGVLSDRIKGVVPLRWWLLLGAAGAPVAMILLFHVPDIDTVAKAIYISITFSLYMLVFSTFSVPYLSIVSEITANAQQRTTILAWRLVFTAIGVLISGSAAPIFIQHQGGHQPAFEQMSQILAVICPVALIIAFFGAKAGSKLGFIATAKPKTEGFPLREALSALASPRFSVLFFANIIQLAGAGMAYAATVYFMTYTLGRADALTQVGFIVVIASLSIIPSQPVWIFLAKRFGKKRTYIASSLLYAATMIGWGILGPIDFRFSYLFAALLGLSNSGWTLLSFSIVSDLGEDGRSGLYSSIWVAADKIGFALGGTLLIGLVLSAFSFDSMRAMQGLPQSHAAMVGVTVAYNVIPAAMSILSALIFALWGRTSPQTN